MESPSNKISLLLKNDIKIYPETNGFKLAVCVWDGRQAVFKKKKTVGAYKHTSKTINEALEQSLNHVYNLIINKVTTS
ncbi:hypothetical protein [Joostella sp.]|uniref:hypothetical protein n=1 Tax=Joostella sp. TaxID=2231138 RepID=UPI003A91B119